MQITLTMAQAIAKAHQAVITATAPCDKATAMAIYKAVTEAAMQRLMK